MWTWANPCLVQGLGFLFCKWGFWLWLEGSSNSDYIVISILFLPFQFTSCFATSWKYTSELNFSLTLEICWLKKNRILGRIQANALNSNLSDFLFYLWLELHSISVCVLFLLHRQWSYTKKDKRTSYLSFRSPEHIQLPSLSIAKKEGCPT